MLLDLGTIRNRPGGMIPFETEMDFSEMEFGSSRPVTEPVRCSGQVRNEADVLLLTADLDTTLHCVCDRCTKPFLRPFHETLEAVVVSELAHEQNEDEWTFLLQGDCADLDDILTTGFVLNLDTRFLCDPDCKGLCPTCGKDLNEGPCDCRKEMDPRWAALKQLLETETNEG